MNARFHMFRKRHSVSIAVFSFAFALRLGLFLVIQPWRQDVAEHRIIVDDAVTYHRLAVNLLTEGAYSNAEGPPYARHMYRTPMYPFFLTAVYFLFGTSVHAAVFVQLIISACMCVILYRLGLMLFGPAVARTAALLLAVDHSQIVYANQLLSETLFTFLFLIHVYWFFLFLLHRRTRHLVYAGFFLGFSVLCRPVAMYYIVIIAAVLLMWFRENVKSALGAVALVAAVLFTSLAPWLARNYALSGGGVFVSEMEEIALSWYTESIRERMYRSDVSSHPSGQENQTEHSGELRTDTDGLVPVLARETMEYAGKLALFFIMPAGGENVYAGLLHTKQRQWDRDDFIEKPAQLLSDARSSIPLRQWVVIIFSAVWLLFINTAVILGVRSGWRTEKGRFVKTLLAIIFYFALATGAAFAARFRVPILPYMMLLAGAGLSRTHRVGTRLPPRRISAD